MKTLCMVAAFLAAALTSKLHGQEIVEGSHSGIRESSRPFDGNSSGEAAISFAILADSTSPVRYVLIPAFVGANRMLNGGVTVGYRNEFFGQPLWLRVGYSRTEVGGESGSQALSTTIRIDPISNQRILGLPWPTSLVGAISYRRRFNTSLAYRVEASIDQGILGDVISLGGSLALAARKSDGLDLISDLILTPGISLSLGEFLLSYDYTCSNDVDGADSYSITGTYQLTPSMSDTPIQAIMGYQKGETLFVNFKLMFR